MKVKLHTTYAGPEGSHQPGAVINVTDEHAQELIDGGFAIDHVKAEEDAEQKREEARQAKRDAAEKEKAAAKKSAKAAPENASKSPPQTR